MATDTEDGYPVFFCGDTPYDGRFRVKRHNTSAFGRMADYKWFSRYHRYATIPETSLSRCRFRDGIYTTGYQSRQRRPVAYTARYLFYTHNQAKS